MPKGRRFTMLPHEAIRGWMMWAAVRVTVFIAVGILLAVGIVEVCS